jgi:hypothetical protein
VTVYAELGERDSTDLFDQNLSQHKSA